jgi:hypothetical protein
MKTLLLLLLLAACGKNEMPPENDMNDSDGDSIPNYREAEMDKYISKVVPLQEVETEIEFQTGLTKLTSHKFLISNKIDLQKYSVDLLVRNLVSLQTNDYFSEFSHLRMKPGQTIVLSEPGVVRVTLKSTKIQTAPTSVFLSYPDKKIPLGTWSPNMEINIASEDLNAILQGEANFAITNLTDKKLFLDKTQDDTIREKTFRVLYNDGSKTDIFYISKELKFEDILKFFNIESYKNIEEQNLLTTTHKPLSAEWWVRKINDRDIIIVKEDIRSLSEFYLQGFEKKKLSLKRQNGVAHNNLVISKQPGAKVLLKIRGNKSLVTFNTKTKEDSGNVGKERYWVCELYNRTATVMPEIEILGTEIENNLKLNGMTPTAVQALADEMGAFLEVEISSDQTEFELKLENFAQNQYLPVGLYHKVCDKRGTSGPDLRYVPQAPEGSLSLNIEAFVEKI